MMTSIAISGSPMLTGYPLIKILTGGIVIVTGYSKVTN